LGGEHTTDHGAIYFIATSGQGLRPRYNRMGVSVFPVDKVRGDMYSTNARILPYNGDRLALTNITKLNEIGSVDGHGNECLISNNVTNAWQAVYNIYGWVWYHRPEMFREAKKTVKFVPLEVMAGDSESSDNEDSSVAEHSFENEEGTDGSRSLGSVNSASS